MLEKRQDNKRGQVAIFIIVAVLFIAGIGAVVLLSKSGISPVGSKEFKPVVEYISECVAESVRLGGEILGEQGGYIEMSEFETGSAHSPTGSQLDFLGTPVAYWKYVSGNGIEREQMPTKRQMQEQLGEFVLARSNECELSEFRKKGFEIDFSINDAEILIDKNEIRFDVDTELKMAFGEKTASVEKISGKVESKLGSFYAKALEIYNKEKSEMFLENYAVDALRLYAPVDGVELGCGAKMWKFSDVESELKNSFEANIQAINTADKSQDYFAKRFSAGSGEGIRFLYSRNWPTKIEVSGEKVSNGVLIAEPIGMQEGFGILGFCYVPYHFVYDILFPALIQIYDDDELFQFATGVVIEKNKARQGVIADAEEFESNLCKFKNEQATIYTYNAELEPVEADISFRCLGESCDIGKTASDGKEAVLSAEVPQCVNGAVFASAEGYAGKKQSVSTNQRASVELILDKLYNVTLEIDSNGRELSELAVVNFVSAENTISIAWPETKVVRLSEGEYEISLMSYKNGSILIPASTENKCVKTARPGLLGILGQTKEKCFDATIPAQTLNNVVSGGGRAKAYFLPSQLAKGKIKIITPAVKTPTSLEELQNAYIEIENNKLLIE